MDRIEKLKSFLAKTPGDSFLKHALAMEYLSLGDLSTAENFLREVIDENPAYVGSYYQLGKILESKNDRVQAQDVYRRGLQEARQQADHHAASELSAALEDIED